MATTSAVELSVRRFESIRFPLSVPETVAVDGGDLVATGIRSPDLEYGESRRLLDAFLRLSEATEERIAAFARSFGVLLLDEHGAAGMRSLDWSWSYEPWFEGGEPYREPVAAWRAYAWFARDTLRLGSALAEATQTVVPEKSLGSLEEPVVWDGGFPPIERREFLRDLGNRSDGSFLGLKDQRRAFARIVSRTWLDMARFHPAMQWEPDDAPCVIMTPGEPWLGQGRAMLINVLASEIVGRLSNVRTLSSCDLCGYPVAGTRQRRPDQPRYCETCREENDRRRKRDDDARRRAERKASE